jgi:cyclomaltodextrinase / maltogenic alpha-amylase / neopullulanase
LKLIEEVHNRGMKIIIDGVFNHTGVEFWAFKDIVEKDENSVYKDWYIIESFDNPSTTKNDFVYKGWWNIRSLPEFSRTDDDLHPGPKQYIYHATARWMDPDGDGDPSDGIDGWRLDVARDVPLGFWKDWSWLVKTLNPTALIVGELWELSPDFISETGPFDALMNYNFAYAVKDLFIDQKNKISVAQFVQKLEEVENTYPRENRFVLQNLMTSHDTERLSSLIKNPDRNYDRDADERNPDYDPSKPDDKIYELQKLIAAFQMTYLGAPMIYYGDEAGMWGADDPHCRKPMVWDDLIYDDEVIDKNSGFAKGFGTFTVEPNDELKKFYAKLMGIRNSNVELRRGNARFLFSNDKKNIFAFERVLNEKKSIIVFNLGTEGVEISLPSGFERFMYINLLTGQSGVIENFEGQPSALNITIQEQSFGIYKILNLEK